MSGKDKIDKEYKQFEAAIEQIVREEIESIQQKTAAIKSEAEEVGEAVEKTLIQAGRGKKS